MSGILVIDDSLTVRMDLLEGLEEAGLRVVAVPTVAAAREALAAEDFALAILDVLLPDGDGLDLLAEIRTTPRTADLRVLLLSTEAEVADRVRGLTTGADEYVGKPYERANLVARARELLSVPAPGERGAPVVLVIDDSATWRDVLSGTLGRAGYEVLTAASGEEGLRVAAACLPSAVVVDGVLPGVDGPTVIRRIRLDAALRRTPCLLLTSAEDDHAELRAFESGADAFVRKDADLDFLLARLAAVLRSAAVEQQSGGPTSLASPKRILAVDDSPTFLDTIGTVLRGEGYEVVPARSGEEALDLLAVQGVDCILLDLGMPGIGGTETCRRIKAAPGMRDIPLLMLTAREDREAMIEGLSAGADDYIAKSSDLAVLKARVLAQIRRKQFEDENRRIREQLVRSEIEAHEAVAARELAEARAELLADLERKNRELEAFSYSVSHDLRAPLRSVGGFSQVLLEEYAPALDERGRDYLRRICRGADRMGELIDDMLELSRIERGEIRRQAVDLSEMAWTVVGELRRAEPDRQVNVTVEEGLVADADARFLRMALDNLLGNAWKFTARTAEPRIEVGALPGPIYFVRDNGVGFDMKHVDRLFIPFQRLHGGDFAGTGIGLATIARIVERHGGRVWAEGAVGEGATLSFTLPPRGQRT